MYYRLTNIDEKPLLKKELVAMNDDEYKALLDKTNVFKNPILNYDHNICLQKVVGGRIVNRDSVEINLAIADAEKTQQDYQKARLIELLHKKNIEISTYTRMSYPTDELEAEFNTLKLEYESLNSN